MKFNYLYSAIKEPCIIYNITKVISLRGSKHMADQARALTLNILTAQVCNLTLFEP